MKQVACGSEHSLILTQLGEMYACGRNHKGLLGFGQDVNDRHLATRLSSISVKQVAADREQSICVNSEGYVMAWGSTCQSHVNNWTPKIVDSLSI